MRAADTIVALLLIGVAIVVVEEGLRLGIGWGTDGPRPGFFVFYLGLVLGMAGAVLVWQARRSRGVRVRGGPFVEPGQLVPVAKVLLPAAGMIVLTHLVGLYVAGGLYLATYMRWIGRHSWVLTVVLGVGIPAATFVIFEVWFLVPLPKGPLEALLGY